MTTGENIRRERKKAKLTQKELGEKLGVSQVRIAQYENGKIEPKIETIDKIAQVLGVYISSLKECIPMEEREKTTEYKKIIKKVASFDAMITILKEIYGDVEEIKVKEGYSCGYFFSVGTKDGRFVLHAEDIDALCDATKAAIPFIVDRIKDERTIEEVYSEYAEITPEYMAYLDERESEILKDIDNQNFPEE